MEANPVLLAAMSAGNIGTLLFFSSVHVTIDKRHTSNIDWKLNMASTILKGF